MELKRMDETMAGAGRAYIPLMEKTAFVDYAAQRCFDRLEVRFDEDGLGLPVAPMYKESASLKKRYLMGAFVKLYLGQTYEPVEGDEWLMSADDYDRWAEQDILWKFALMAAQAPGDAEEWAADVRRDFSVLQELLESEVAGLLAVMNDPIWRFLTTMQAQTTPEMFRKGAEELQRLREELEAYQKDFKEGGERENGGE